MEALLSADDVRIDARNGLGRSGGAVVDGLRLATRGRRVLVLGAPRELFEAAAGMRAVARGTLAVDGRDPATAARAGRVAAAPLDPPLPPGWTALDYAAWSARLVGAGGREARAAAERALDEVGVRGWATTRLARVPPAGRRGVVLAAALATGARTILAFEPLAGLDGAEALATARALLDALGDRAWLIFAPRVPLASPLAARADEAIVVAGAQVVAQGVPADIAARDGAYAVRIDADDESRARAVAAVEARGARVTLGAPFLTIDLAGAISTRELVGIAAEARAIVVELRPVAHAFT